MTAVKQHITSQQSHSPNTVKHYLLYVIIRVMLWIKQANHALFIIRSRHYFNKCRNNTILETHTHLYNKHFDQTFCLLYLLTNSAIVFNKMPFLKNVCLKLLVRTPLWSVHYIYDISYTCQVLLSITIWKCYP